MTQDQRRLALRYLAYRTLGNMWFYGAVWLYFYRIFITDYQVGILDAMAFAIGLIAEVPSGALADKFGRDKMVRLGQCMVACGLFIQVTGSSFMPFLVGQAVLMIGMAFVSGADEALFFEKLNFKRDSLHWRKLMTRGSQAALIGSLVALPIGGLLHTINPRLPWILTGIVFLIAALLIWPIKDTRPRDARGSFATEVNDYFNNIKQGFHQFRLPKLRIYVPIIMTVQGLFYLTGWGILQLVLLDRFHFTPFWGSIAIAFVNLVTVGILASMHKHTGRLSEKRVLVFISLAAAASLLLSVADIGLWGFVVIFALHAGEYTLQPFMSEILNNRATNDQRATVLSVSSFFKMVPYVCLAPLIGYLSTGGHLAYFLVGWSVAICVATALYLIAKKRDSQIIIPQA